MTSVAKRRINFVVELTFYKSTIEEMSREQLMSAFLDVLKHTTNHMNYVDNTWIVGAAIASMNDEPVSYNWFMTDSEYDTSEDIGPPKESTN